MDNALIQLKEVSFAAQDKQIVSGVSLDIFRGTTTAFVGPSGGGKSSVLKLTAGLILPTSGQVQFRGHPVATMSRARNLAFRRESAFVFQDSALWANQSIRQILELPLKVHYPDMNQKQRTERIVEVLAQSGYKKNLDIRPSELSMGEQKLIAFSRALLCDPKILFLDEWTESLDDAAARRLISIVKKKQAEGATIAFVSHNLGIIQSLAGTICMIADGKLTLTVSAEEFERDSGLAKTIEQGIAQ